ncbi:MAG: hypothetical protein N838_15070 [Thiohalocapsa sp. PB-PSB1]|nr:MAG: hypothetical protein N838_15070 [Thiohalocapsa sp. PB-PSB1]
MRQNPVCQDPIRQNPTRKLAFAQDRTPLVHIRHHDPLERTVVNHAQHLSLPTYSKIDRTMRMKFRLPLTWHDVCLENIEAESSSLLLPSSDLLSGELPRDLAGHFFIGCILFSRASVMGATRSTLLDYNWDHNWDQNWDRDRNRKDMASGHKTLDVYRVLSAKNATSSWANS